MNACKSNVGFTLVEIMIVVAIIGLLASIAIPNFLKAREDAQQKACINNMRAIDSAVNQWAMENGKTTGATAPTLSNDLTPYIRLNAASSIPGCPAGGAYTVNALGNNPQIVCSLSVGVHARHILT